jgi:ParB family transcriptional regulator, chromosome partitioning protein
MKRRPSPLLTANAHAIGAAAEGLVTRSSRFAHSREIDLDQMRSDPNQPRKLFDEAKLQQLAESMRQHGQLQPVLVQSVGPQSYVVLAGERRWRAAQILGWPTLLAIELPDADKPVVQLIENMQREELSAIEEARGMAELMRERGWTQRRVAETLGRNEAEVSRSLRLLDLPSAILDRLATSQVPRNVLYELTRIDDPTALAALAEQALIGGLTVRAARTAADTRARAPGPQRSTRASPTTVDRLLRELRSQPSGQGLPNGMRDRLHALRAEIERLLTNT